MKNAFYFICFLLLTNYSFSQITVIKADGGTVVTRLIGSIKINDGSSLNREWVSLNDERCPVKLNNVGKVTTYADRSYDFKPVGNISVSEPITAYEIHHVLYNVFGEHMKTLSNSEVADINDKDDFSKYSSWYASENQVGEYLICVSYVANVRTKNGAIWRYSAKAIKDELLKIKLKYEEDYIPPKETGKKE